MKGRVRGRPLNQSQHSGYTSGCMAFTTEAARWRALVTRDANANGQFIYSVRSTSIYCRPTCPGRLARRANVEFYETASQAEAAGFRACKRCKPDTVLEDPQVRAVEKACILIDEASSKDNPTTFTLQSLAKKVGLTPRYFHKIFKDKTGCTPKEYAKQKQSAHSSLITTPLSSTTESSVPTWDFDTFHFNDLVDYSADARTISTGEFAVSADQALQHDARVGLDTYDLNQPWSTEHESNNVLSIYVAVDDPLRDPFGAIPECISLYGGKDQTTVSTFELDATLLLSCDSFTDMFPI